MRIILNIILHLIILFIVVVFPVVVYTFMSDHNYNDFAFIGGVSYFIYAFYLVLKIKNQRAKTILLGILYSLLFFWIGMLFMFANEFAIIITTVINLALQAFLFIKNPRSANQAVWKSYLINFIITILFSIFFTFLWFVSMAAAGLPSNHY